MMDEKLLKIMSDGTKLPIDVYRAFTDQCDFFKQGNYIVRTDRTPSLNSYCLFEYATTVFEQTEDGEKVRAFKILSESSTE